MMLQLPLPASSSVVPRWRQALAKARIFMSLPRTMISGTPANSSDT